MRRATAAFLRTSERLPGYQRNTRGLWIFPRIIARNIQSRARSRLDIADSPYVLGEVTKNLGKLPSAAIGEWASLKEQIVIVNDIVSLSFPVVFTASKDRPILFSALAWSQVLLTLDRQDFVTLIGREFYGLRVRLPYEFLREERSAGRIKM